MSDPRFKEAIGWPFLSLPDQNGELQYPSLEQSVRDAIRIILSTRPGEQLMRPNFGGGLAEFVHEPNTIPTRRRIRDLVQAALARWEPRIVVDRVEVAEVADRPTHVRIDVAYRLRRTGSAQTVGATLELEAS